MLKTTIKNILNSDFSYSKKAVASITLNLLEEYKNNYEKILNYLYVLENNNEGVGETGAVRPQSIIEFINNNK